MSEQFVDGLAEPSGYPSPGPSPGAQQGARTLLLVSSILAAGALGTNRVAAQETIALDEISDIATHRPHFEGSSQGTLTWAVTRDGFAKLRIIVEHAIANRRTTR